MVKKTIQEIDLSIRQLLAILKQNPDLELGESNLVTNFLSQLELIQSDPKQILADAYSLKSRKLEHANLYFDFDYSLETAISYLRELKEKGYGNRNQTRTAIELVEACLRYLGPLAEDAKAFKYETHLNILTHHVHSLKKQHPIRDIFEQWADNLRKSWEGVSDQDQLNEIINRLDRLSRILTKTGFLDLSNTTTPLISTSDLLIDPNNVLDPVETCWAIIVGVTKHKRHDVFGELLYTNQDAFYLAKRLLSSPRGYKRDNLFLFADKESTLEAETGLVSNGSPDWKMVLDCVRHITGLAKSNDLLLFFFSGHGHMDKQLGASLVCQDTDPDHLDRTAITMSEIKREIQNSDARVKLIFLDTCHSGSIMEQTRNKSPMSNEYIREVFELANGLFIMTSCGPDEYSYPLIDKGMGVFSYYLVEGLEQARHKHFDFVTTTSLKEHIEREVSLWALANEKYQKPQWEARNMVGDPIVIDWRKG